MIHKTIGWAVLAALFAGCVSEPATDTVAEEVRGGGSYCEGDCWCPQGSICDLAERRCAEVIDFSPPMPGPACGATCQCSYGETCVRSDDARYGYCAPGGVPCASHCDCPHGTICSEGRCSPDFGPYPGCYCDNHCGSGEVCRSGHCVAQGRSGRGGSGNGGGDEFVQ